MSKKQFTVQRIYKGMDDGVKYYDWCIMKDDTVILRLDTRMDCIDVIEMLNELEEENEQLKEDYDYLEKRFKEEEWHYDYIDEDRDAWRHKCQELEKENERLKQFIQSLAEQSVNGKVMLRDGKVYDLNKILKKGDVE